MPFKNNEDRKKYMRQYDKKYYQEHTEEHREQRKKYYKNNTKKVLERVKRYRRTLRGRFFTYKKSAKDRGLIFGFTLDEFVKIIKKPCHYCGGEGYGIDRLDSSIGYLKGNVVSCCSMCNRMKWAYTEEDFIHQCTKISDNH